MINDDYLRFFSVWRPASNGVKNFSRDSAGKPACSVGRRHGKFMPRRYSDGVWLPRATRKVHSAVSNVPSVSTRGANLRAGNVELASKAENRLLRSDFPKLVKKESMFRERIEAAERHNSMPSLSTFASILFVLWFFGFVGVYYLGAFLPLLLLLSIILALIRVGQGYGYVGTDAASVRARLASLWGIPLGSALTSIASATATSTRSAYFFVLSLRKRRAIAK